MTRTYGTGTMAEVRTGVWRFRVFTEDPISGRRRQVSKTVRTKSRPSKKDLEAQLAKFKSEVAKKKSTGRTATVGKVCDDWLADLERVGRAKTTLETYRTHVETRIRPALGAVPLDKMDPARVRAFIGSLKGSPRTIRLSHAILRGALAFAVKNDWMAMNPASRVDPPKVAKDTDEALTPEEVAQLIAAAQAESPVMGVAVALAAITGCRRGELCGLRWTDVDWQAQTIRIERAWVPGVGGQSLGSTKTDERRTVSLKGYGLTLLKRWRSAQVKTYGELGEWLLSDSDGSEPLRAKTVTETFTRLARALGLDCHFHDLRHFAATQLIGLTDVKSAAGRLGHTPKVMLETYSHGIAERDAAASVAIGSVVQKALGRAKAPQP